MEIAVYDIYVTKKDGSVMHFDIIVPANLKDTFVIYSYSKEYLKTKGQEGQNLSSKECLFFHIEKVKPQWEEHINRKDYYICEMENCD